MFKIQPIQHGHFVFQQMEGEEPLMVAWFHERFDAQNWVDQHNWQDVPGVEFSGTPFTLTIVPFSLPDPQLVRIPYTSKFVPVPYGKTLADVLNEVAA
jgi:hypothetical protein